LYFLFVFFLFFLLVFNQRNQFLVFYYALISLVLAHPSITLQEAGLRALWSVNGPRILQVGYEDEEDPKVMEAYERVGSLVCQSSLVLLLQCFLLFVFLRLIPAIQFAAGSWLWDRGTLQ
jgi:hypothetical protein